MPRDGFSPVQPVLLTADDLRLIVRALDGQVEVLRHWAEGQAGSGQVDGALTDLAAADEMLRVRARVAGVLAVKEAA